MLISRNYAHENARLQLFKDDFQIGFGGFFG
jgi:hypothetical protein